MSYPNDNLSDDIDALISGADALSAAADSIATIASGSDVVVSNFDHVEEVFDNLQAFLSKLKSGHFYTPVGALMPFAGTGAYVPSGWLVCDGRSFAASGASADLQTILGAAGFTTLPNLSGKVIAGVGTILGSSRAVGAAVGAESLPVHTHDGTYSGSNSLSGSASVSGTLSGSASVQAQGLVTRANGSGAAYNTYVSASPQTTLNGSASVSGTLSGSSSVSGTVSVSGTSGNATDGIDSTFPFTAASGYHGVVQPTVVMNYIIKN